MTFESWAAFTAASAVLLIIPGPTVLLVVSYALGQGWRTALPMAIGVALGDFTAMTLSMLGLGALLAASATLFTILKWVGAAYLVYLGIKLWRAGGALEAAPRTDAVSAAKMLGHAWLVTALNPKSITFFVAFLPAFLDPHADFLTQMLVFETTFLLLAFANAFGYALVASRARGFVSNPRAIGIINKDGRQPADRRRRGDRHPRGIAELTLVDFTTLSPRAAGRSRQGPARGVGPPAFGLPRTRRGGSRGRAATSTRPIGWGMQRSRASGWSAGSVRCGATRTAGRSIRWSWRPAGSAAASARRCSSGSRRVPAATAS